MSYFPHSRTSGSTADSLRQMMQANGLTNADVADLCCVSIKTVESWLATPGCASFRAMPPRQINLLAFGLPSFLSKRKAAQKLKK